MLVTSGTVTSAAMMQARLPPGAMHQYVPLDTPARGGALSRSLAAGRRPVRGIRSLAQPAPGSAAARGVKLALINARISERSAAGWRRAPQMARSAARRLRHRAGAGRGFRGALPRAGRARCDGGGQPEGRCAAAVLRRGRAGGDARRLSARGPCCWRPRPIPARTKPCCPPMTCCARAFPICSPSSCRAIPSAAPISPCCAAAAPARAAPPASRITAETAIYIADTMGELGLFYRLRAFLLSGRHPGADGRAQSAGAGGAQLRRAGGAASRANSRTRLRGDLGAQGFGDVRHPRRYCTRSRRGCWRIPQAAARGRRGSGAGRGNASRARWRRPSPLLKQLLDADARA